MNAIEQNGTIDPVGLQLHALCPGWILSTNHNYFLITKQNFKVIFHRIEKLLYRKSIIIINPYPLTYYPGP